MITREFVQKYLDIKEKFEHKQITEIRYKISILELCDEYDIEPAKLSEYNMDIEPKKFHLQ